VREIISQPVFALFTNDPQGAENLRQAFELADLNHDDQMDLEEFLSFMEE
jgi:hypothetical protein